MRSSSEVAEEDRVSLFISHIIREDISYFADDNVSCRIEAVYQILHPYNLITVNNKEDHSFVKVRITTLCFQTRHTAFESFG